MKLAKHYNTKSTNKDLFIFINNLSNDAIENKINIKIIMSCLIHIFLCRLIAVVMLKIRLFISNNTCLSTRSLSEIIGRGDLNDL